MQIRLSITDINQQGQGVGRDETGLIHFVDGALPGETVDVTVKRKTSGYAVSHVDRLEQPARDRVTPPCPVFGRCGGCSLQHLDYRAELIWKASRVEQTLRRIGGLDLTDVEVRPIVGMADPWAYRNKAAYPVGRRGKDPVLGFFAARSHTIVPHDTCLVLTPGMNDVRRTVETLIRRDGVEPYDEVSDTGILRHVVVRQSKTTGAIQVMFVVKAYDARLEQWPAAIAAALAASDLPALESAHVMRNQKPGNAIFGEPPRHLYGAETIRETLNGLSFDLRPEAFFQVNSAQAANLFATVAEWAAERQNRGASRQTLDLYCGSGTIALHLAKAGMPVTGVDVVAAAIDEASQNAKRNGLSQATFVAADAVAYVTAHGVHDIGMVVLDPPRKGCDQRLLDALLSAESLQTILYVSCNPATLARDVAVLKETFKLVRYQPVDMFPHTTHVETVVLMSRAEK